jgi:hypothetical protein
MGISEKDKLRHDFLNSISVINSMTKSAASFVEKISKIDLDHGSAATTRQLELFIHSMGAIRHEVTKVEQCFNEAIKNK